MSAPCFSSSLFTVIRQDRWLIVRFKENMETLSSALCGGGRASTANVAWLETGGSELRPEIDPREFLREKLQRAEIDNAVGMMTSRSLDSYITVKKEAGGKEAACVATVGLTNILRVGDPSGDLSHCGTVNILCCISEALSESAMAEALSIAAEARTVAILEAGIPSRRTFEPASGTGTDCIVIACKPGTQTHSFCGKHTLLGQLIGASVLEAVQLGVSAWKRDYGFSQRCNSI